MRNHLAPTPGVSQHFPGSKVMLQQNHWAILFGLTLGLTAWWSGGLNPHPVQAESAATAPPQLKNALTQIDAAANNRNVQAVMQFYSKNFAHSDGLTYQSLEKTLAELWKRYPKLTYKTELQSWQPSGNGFSAETVTRITGVQSLKNRDVKLEATLRSQQRFENQKIVRQEILAERTQLTAGTNPPKVEMQLPEQVPAGQEFSFDAIVREPLGNKLLLGSAVEETVKPSSYLSSAPINLELLSGGGLFKIGRAPAQPANRWISALLIREDGMTLITQRLRVTGRDNRSNAPKPKR